MIDLYNDDCLEVMKDIKDKSIDMILCDLPYGTTDCKWDNIIPFEPLWEQYNRIIKDNGAIVLFGSEPFTSKLIMSNLQMHKYDWYWNKKSTSGFVNAKLKPMNTMEIVSVFSKGKTSNGNKNNMKYFPQGLEKISKVIKSQKNVDKENTYTRPSMNGKLYIQEYTNYPKNYLEFSTVKGKKALHPTEKPVPLLEYLIKTYTNEGDVVLDNCMGSGSTGVACLNTKRNFIGIELDKNYFEIAKNRIESA